MVIIALIMNEILRWAMERKRRISGVSGDRGQRFERRVAGERGGREPRRRGDDLLQIEARRDDLRFEEGAVAMILVERGARRLVLDRHQPAARRRREHGEIRSEEHTSELQSLMRISYAVFCLKKKNNKKQ